MRINKDGKTVWDGTHNGVAFEIQNFKRKGLNETDQDCWTMYLYISLGKIPEEHKPKSYWLKAIKTDFGRNMYKYYNHPVLGSIDFHWGPSWYSKETGWDGDTKVIKIGCDYMHLGDDERSYDLDHILRDVERAVESFRRLVPGYKYWCYGNGGLYDVSEGELNGESFKSYDWIKSKKKKAQLK